MIIINELSLAQKQKHNRKNMSWLCCSSLNAQASAYDMHTLTSSSGSSSLGKRRDETLMYHTLQLCFQLKVSISINHVKIWNKHPSKQHVAHVKNSLSLNTDPPEPWETKRLIKTKNGPHGDGWFRPLSEDQAAGSMWSCGSIGFLGPFLI